MDFRFFPLRFELLANETIAFPPEKAANVLRGAMGMALRRLSTSHYAAIWEPSARAGSPSGFADPPRPFVIRARHLDGRSLPEGERFFFELHVFSLDRDLLACFVKAIEAMAQAGFGAQRGAARLLRVLGLSPEGPRDFNENSPPMVLRLESVAPAPPRIRVDFLTPTELKDGRRLAERPEFPILIARARDRISSLRNLYGAGPLEIDYAGMNERAGAVRMVACQIRRVRVERRSSRTGQVHPIGGFVGTAEYEGDLAGFLPYLEAARWTGVGRQAVWGKGEIAVAAQAP